MIPMTTGGDEKREQDQRAGETLPTEVGVQEQRDEASDEELQADGPDREGQGNSKRSPERGVKKDGLVVAQSHERPARAGPHQVPGMEAELQCIEQGVEGDEYEYDDRRGHHEIGEPPLFPGAEYLSHETSSRPSFVL